MMEEIGEHMKSCPVESFGRSIFATGIAMLLATLGFCGLAGAADSSATLCLSGSDWRIHEDLDGKGADRGLPAADCSAAGWIPATVPGNIQADLEAAHLLRPLWYGAGDPRLYDVARKNWWYRKDFNVPAAYAGKRLTLVCDGVDHECEVWLNGKLIGHNAGMFRRFCFDITAAVQPGKTNCLAVRISRMPEELVPLLIASDGRGVDNAYTPDGFMTGDSRTRRLLKDLKSQTNWGYDWGTNIWTLGIWKDVHLVASGPARIDWTRVQAALGDDFAKATVAASLEVDSLADAPMQARFRVTGHGQEATGRWILPSRKAELDPSGVDARQARLMVAKWSGRSAAVHA